MGQNEEPAQRTVCPGNQNLIIHIVIRKTGQPSEFLFTEKDCASKRRGHIWFKQIRPPIAVEAAPAMVLTSKLQDQYTKTMSFCQFLILALLVKLCKVWLKPQQICAYLHNSSKSRYWIAANVKTALNSMVGPSSLKCLKESQGKFFRKRGEYHERPISSDWETNQWDCLLFRARK